VSSVVSRDKCRILRLKDVIKSYQNDDKVHLTVQLNGQKKGVFLTSEGRSGSRTPDCKQKVFLKKTRNQINFENTSIQSISLSEHTKSSYCRCAVKNLKLIVANK
jgi:hypothetical protein